MERQNLRRATRIVVLTERGCAVLRSRGVDLPIDVIPTCVDCDQFVSRLDEREAAFDIVYFGSLGGWYMTSEMLDFVDEIRKRGDPIRVLFLTNNMDAATQVRLDRAGVTVKTASPEQVPSWLSQCRSAFFFIRATPSKMASCPTKLAEALAMGLPVLTGPGVGDVDEILRRENVGVVLDDFSPDSFWHGWKAMTTLLKDPQTPARCRSVALGHLSLTQGVACYERVYEEMGRATK